jgi:hypothetical protein
MPGRRRGELLEDHCTRFRLHGRDAGVLADGDASHDDLQRLWSEDATLDNQAWEGTMIIGCERRQPFARLLPP